MLIDLDDDERAVLLDALVALSTHQDTFYRHYGEDYKKQMLDAANSVLAKIDPITD